MREIILDTETFKAPPGGGAPRLVGLGWNTKGTQNIELLHGNFDRVEIVDLLEESLEETIIWTHGAEFDLTVFAAYEPSLLPAIWRALKEGRIRCTYIGSRLLANAQGWLSIGNFSLDAMIKRFTGRELEKDDSIRLTYDTLWDVPIDQWDEKYRRYLRHDVMAHDHMRYHLEAERNDVSAKYLPERLDIALSDETWSRWTKLAFIHKLTSLWGPRTDGKEVISMHRVFDAYQKELMAKLQAFTVATEVTLKNGTKEIQELPLIRANGSQDKRATRQHVLNVYAPDTPEATDTGKEILAGTRKEEFDPLAHTSTSKGTLLQAGDDICVTLQEFAAARRVVTSYLNNMLIGSVRPLSIRYTCPLVTGRCSSSGELNMQNQPRRAKVIIDGKEQTFDIRRCFRPRDGHVFIAADYDSLEVRTLGQSIKDLIGWSTIADYYREDPDFDPHGLLGAILAGQTQEEFRKNLVAKDRFAKDMRQLAKVPNFGYPGGMGPRTLIEYAYDTYGLVLTLEEAKDLKTKWSIAWPDAVAYLKYITSSFAGVDRKKGITVWTEKTQFVRGGCSFCAAANHRFQNLAAHIAQEALARVYEECYIQKSSPLHGCRPFTFVHDELILECPTAQYKEAAARLSEVMVADPQGWMEDVPLRATAYAMFEWNKSADAVYDSAGELLIYGAAS